MTMGDYDIDLRKEFDDALSAGDQRAIRQTLKRALSGSAEGKNLADKFNDSTWNITEDDHAKIIEILGRVGLSKMTGQRILSIAAEHDNHAPGVAELKPREGGLLGASDQAGAGVNAARVTAGLNIDRTPNLVNSFVHVDPLNAVSAMGDEADEEPDEDGTPDPKKPKKNDFTPVGP